MKRFSLPRLLGAALLAAGVTLVVTPAASPAAPTSTQPSMTALSVAQSKLNQAASSRPGSVTGWYVDGPARSIVVEVLGSEQDVTQWAARHGAGAVRIEHVSEAPRPLWNLIGGQPLYVNTGGRCALGFNAYRSDGRYVITAGHCAAPGVVVSGVGGVIGPVVVSAFPADDYGIIRVTSTSAVSTPLVDRYSAGPDVTVTGVGSATVGSSVCRSGPTTGWRCGSVTALNQTVCYPQGCAYGLIRTSLCAEPGDSGGPVVTNPGTGSRAQAVGIVSGGSGNCSTGGTTYVVPIRKPLNAFGLTLYTG